MAETSGWPPRYVGTAQKADMPSRRATKAARKVAEEAAWRAVCKAVDARDGKACRCCDKRSDPDATGLLERGHRHHIVYRSAGGEDSTANILHLCAACHEDEHRHRLVIRCLSVEKADGPMVFMRRDDKGELFISREEIAVRHVRRD